MRLAVFLFAVLLFSWAPASAQDAYTLGPQDVIQVSVFGHEELSGKFTVAVDGTVTYPLLGTVRAAGLTVADLQGALVNRLADGYLRKPQVSVEILQFLSKRVYAVGEVRTPGAVTLTGTASLLDVLVKAGSVTELAGGDIQLLRRTGGGASGPVAPGQPGVSEIARVSVQQLRRGAVAFNGTLLDGDTIFVPRAESVFVLGNVNNPGSYAIEAGSTTVLTAIALAGGMTELGSNRRLRVSRIVNGKKVDLDVKLDDMLQPGDTVTVGTRRF